MRLLALDTAGTVAGIALGDTPGEPPHISHQGTPGAAPRHTESLAPMVSAALEFLGWHASSLDALAVTLGPGSFTGLRIGMALAKGISLAGDIPIIPIRTLDALAHSAGFTGSPDGLSPEIIVACIDGRKSRYYNAIYRRRNGSPEYLTRVTDDGDHTLEDLVLRVQSAVAGVSLRAQLVVSGSIPQDLTTALPAAEGVPVLSAVTGLYHLAALQLAAPGAPENALQEDDYLGPVYLRESDIGSPRVHRHFTVRDPGDPGGPSGTSDR